MAPPPVLFLAKKAAVNGGREERGEGGGGGDNDAGERGPARHRERAERLSPRSLRGLARSPTRRAALTQIMSR
ncbi:Hypothetical predicted protein [Podarcis lilfordi]|uniref:Uncharacterized protein n=1 Tax=Podarcis lilfordi TaxID=74358 RepID=A0AA35JYJ7_9SAUR|nr:Hypothetical predicted protein [Podarcis lilfordi]